MVGRTERFLQDATTVHLDSLLFEVSQYRIARKGDRALIRALATCENLEQCRLAGAVRSDQSDPIACPNAQTRVLEQDARTEGLRDVFEGYNHSAKSNTRVPVVGRDYCGVVVII